MRKVSRSGCGSATSISRASTCGSAKTSREAEHGARRHARRVEQRSTQWATSRVAQHRLERLDQRRPVRHARRARPAKRGSSTHSWWPSASARRSKMASLAAAMIEVAVARAEAAVGRGERMVLAGRARAPARSRSTCPRPTTARRSSPRAARCPRAGRARSSRARAARAGCRAPRRCPRAGRRSRCRRGSGPLSVGAGEAHAARSCPARSGRSRGARRTGRRRRSPRCCSTTSRGWRRSSSCRVEAERGQHARPVVLDEHVRTRRAAARSTLARPAAAASRARASACRGWRTGRSSCRARPAGRSSRPRGDSNLITSAP